VNPIRRDGVSIVLSNRRLALMAGLWCVVALAVLAVPPDAFAGEIVEIGRNARREVVGTVGQLFLAAIAVAAFTLFWKRHYTEMAVTAIAGAVVAWVIFSPDAAAQQLKDIVSEILTVGH
jgi:hypothetical protein